VSIAIRVLPLASGVVRYATSSPSGLIEMAIVLRRRRR
jgi:hypothetical protein